MIIRNLLILLFLSNLGLFAAETGQYAAVLPVDFKEVRLTDGFWTDRYAVNRDVSLLDLWQRANNPDTGHVIQNFQIAAGELDDEFAGTFWQDAWLYKWLETASYILASEPDADFQGRDLNELVDEMIELIANAQEDDGYLATQITTVDDFDRFEQMKRHELYTMGHMITAACVHQQITGKRNFLDVAIKAADFIEAYFKKNEAKHPDFPNNPSIIMASVDLYRVTGEKKYLDMANRFVDMRGKYPPKRKTKEEIEALPFHLQSFRSSEGYLNNQNWVPLRESKEVLGHAVFFTYLYAGATDAYLETGDKTLWTALDRLWHDLTEKKMYVTGGVSPHTMHLPTFNFKEGVRETIKADFINEGVAKPYDLPIAHGYNETCGMVGNMMWNWRMLQASGEARFADVMELNWYNSILSGVEIDGVGWSYANPLRWHAEDHEVVHELKYAHKRSFPGRKLICCPTNILRNVASFSGYLYGKDDNTLWLHHYASSEVETELPNGEIVKLVQETQFPWEGVVKLSLLEKGSYQISLRIPYWAEGASVLVNGEPVRQPVSAGSYVGIKRNWKKGDIVELNLPMDVKLLVSDYLFERSRGQVAIKRGPIVYCLESIDIPDGVDIKDVQIPSNAEWEEEYRPNLLGGVTVLKTTAEVVRSRGTRIGAYQELRKPEIREIPIELIPYYAWNNRSEPKMSVWLPLSIRGK